MQRNMFVPLSKIYELKEDGLKFSLNYEIMLAKLFLFLPELLGWSTFVFVKYIVSLFT